MHYNSGSDVFRVSRLWKHNAKVTIDTPWQMQVANRGFVAAEATYQADQQCKMNM